MTTQQKDGDLKTIVQDILRFGDMLIIANKGMGKTVSLMDLTRQLRAMDNTRVIIFETFPKWIHEFDTIPYMVIHDNDVVQTEYTIDMQDFFLKHQTDYSVLKGNEIKEALKSNKDLTFLMEIDDTERISFFIYSIVKYFYRRNYLTAYKYGLDKIKENVVFVCEESQNLFDASIISKKVFNKLRKMYSETRNLKLHFLMASQRLVDLNTKIRGRTKLMIGKVNIDDFDLKVRRILRYSKHRKEILNLARGSFLYPELDVIVKFPLFKQHGKPYQFKPIIQKPQITEQPQQKEGLIHRIKNWFDWSGNVQDTESNIYDDTEKDSDADIEDDALIGEDLFGDEW